MRAPPMAEIPAFQRHQYAFAAHIRDPEHNPAPTGIEDRRMAIYRSLFFNNVSQLLAKTFPVLHQILGAEAWALHRGRLEERGDRVDPRTV